MAAMHKSTLSCVVLFLMTLSAVLVEAVTAEDVIKKARMHIGTEEKLKAVRTLAFRGYILDAEGRRLTTVYMFLKKPDKHRVEYGDSKQIEVVATNGFEGFKLLTTKADNKTQVWLLKHNLVRKMVIDARENLYFFQGHEGTRGAAVSYEGKAQIFGKQADVLKYSYIGGVYYMRYIDSATGVVIATDDENGLRNVEEDATLIDGVRLSKKLNGYTKDGKLFMTIVFESITVNEPLDDGLFEFPNEIYKREDPGIYEFTK